MSESAGPLYWIAHSTTHEADDHKFVDLCTALEILLLPEGQGVKTKGTVIALRYNLLGGDLNPPAVKRMYDRRNDVIHGSRLPVVGPQDTWHLRLVCYAVVQSIVHASADLPDKLTLQDVIDAAETERDSRLSSNEHRRASTRVRRYHIFSKKHKEG